MVDGSRTPPSRVSEDTVIGNPFVHFMVSELWAGLASLVVFFLFRLVAYGTEWISYYLPLQSQAASHFVEVVFGWSAALTSTGTFIIISIYQLIILVKRLWENL